MRYLVLPALLLAACGSPDAEEARRTFLQTLLNNDYDALMPAFDGLAEVYRADPKDPKSTLYFAHAHLWRIAEWERSPDPDPSLRGQMAAEGLRLFREARELSPDDARIDGWIGTLSAALGKTLGNAALVERGYQSVERGWARWPEFNGVTILLAYGDLPTSDPHFQRSLEVAWETFEVCVGGPIDRENPDYGQYIPKQPYTGERRVCSNEDVSPHNFEGFWLQIGDMLVKNGDVRRARIIYNNTRYSSTYDTWPYKSMLEGILADDLEHKAALFRDPDPSKHPLIASQSTHACTSCHSR